MSPPRAPAIIDKVRVPSRCTAHLSNPRRPRPCFGRGSGNPQGAGPGVGAVSQLGAQGSGRARLWRGFSQGLCSGARWSASLCLSWRGSRSVLRSLPARRSPFPLTSPFLSRCLSPARSRDRSTWRSRSRSRSRSRCGRLSGSRSLGRARGSRVPKVSSIARFLSPPGNDPRATTNHKFPRQVAWLKDRAAAAHLCARALALGRSREVTCPWPPGGGRGARRRRGE